MEKHTLFLNSDLKNKSNTGEVIFQSNINIITDTNILTSNIAKMMVSSTAYIKTGIIFPLELHWLPKPDITAFELACCIPYINNYNIFPEEVFDQDGTISKSLDFLKHFKITNHNIEK